MKRVFIVHGWEASPESNWFPWLKKELEKKGIEAIVPAMPDSAQPKCQEWVSYLREKIGRANEDVILVGHSLGVIAILRYLEALPAGEKIGETILVSGFSEIFKDNFPEELKSFFVAPLDYEKVRNSADKFVVIHSDNDPVVPFAAGRKMSDILRAEFMEIHGAEHLNVGNGFFELPIVLEKILEIKNNHNF